MMTRILAVSIALATTLSAQCKLQLKVHTRAGVNDTT